MAGNATFATFATLEGDFTASLTFCHMCSCLSLVLMSIAVVAMSILGSRQNGQVPCFYLVPAIFQAMQSLTHVTVHTAPAFVTSDSIHVGTRSTLHSSTHQHCSSTSSHRSGSSTISTLSSSGFRQIGAWVGTTASAGFDLQTSPVASPILPNAHSAFLGELADSFSSAGKL